MLEDDLPRLAEVVIHETTHTTIFLRGQVAFNESLATFMGNQGTLNFLARVFGPRSPAWSRGQAAVSRRLSFSGLISALYGRLGRAVHERPAPRREAGAESRGLRRAQQRYKELFPDPETWGTFVTSRSTTPCCSATVAITRGSTFTSGCTGRGRGPPPVRGPLQARAEVRRPHRLRGPGLQAGPLRQAANVSGFFAPPALPMLLQIDANHLDRTEI